MFQSTPGISAGRYCTPSRTSITPTWRFNPRPAFLPGDTCALVMSPVWGGGFNPRPAFLPGDTVGSAMIYLMSGVSIHARHFCRAIHPLGWAPYRRSSRFNPRPAFLPGDTGRHRRLVAHGDVSIHARHFCRAILGYPLVDKWFFTFQSTPGISAGRYVRAPPGEPGRQVFQSTPGISAGRYSAIASVSF